ncbi:unnamed protein product [Symbiodinium natans]|uniref:Uncharacterized protein n=1 Tax=Symbiodinium natans TaxID=878477 RepID=A0A812T6L8_9DINO|nr:unnamed protein product [Symbiodinium natans]
MSESSAAAATLSSQAGQARTDSHRPLLAEGPANRESELASAEEMEQETQETFAPTSCRASDGGLAERQQRRRPRPTSTCTASTEEDDAEVHRTGGIACCRSFRRLLCYGQEVHKGTLCDGCNMVDGQSVRLLVVSMTVDEQRSRIHIYVNVKMPETPRLAQACETVVELWL